MSVPKHLFYILNLVVLSVNLVNASGEYYIEQFVDGTTGTFSACPGRSSFVAEKYFLDESGLKPSGLNGFFLTADTNISTEYCMESEPFYVDVGSVLLLRIYTSNSGDTNFFRWAAVSPVDGTNIQSALSPIDDIRGWRSSTITIIKKHTIIIRFSYTPTGTGKEFIAIDRVEIHGERVTTTEPSESTSPDTPEATTPPPITTTDQTTTTEYAPPSSPPPTPEPPSAQNCVCNCNCNYYCGKNPFR